MNGGNIYSDMENFTEFSLQAENMSDGANATDFDTISEEFVSVFNIYYTPLLVLFGLLGNIMSIVVFFKSQLRLYASSQYLTALAISDSMFLIQLLPPWLNAIKVSTVYFAKVYCQLTIYTSYVTCNISDWLVVAFTVERFVVVTYPLKRHVLCTVRRARCIVAVIVAASLLINIPMLQITVPADHDCNIGDKFMKEARSFNLVDTVVSCSVPMAAILILNTWIIVDIYRIWRARRELMKSHHEYTPSRRHQLQILASERSRHRVTGMLLVVSTAFVVLNLPAYLLRIHAYAYNMADADYTGPWAALQQLALLLFHTNFGINFYLYCVSGENFRRALASSLPFLKRCHRNAPPEWNVAYQHRAAPSSNSISDASLRTGVYAIANEHMASNEQPMPTEQLAVVEQQVVDEQLVIRELPADVEQQLAIRNRLRRTGVWWRGQRRCRYNEATSLYHPRWHSSGRVQNPHPIPMRRGGWRRPGTPPIPSSMRVDPLPLGHGTTAPSEPQMPATRRPRFSVFLFGRYFPRRRTTPRASNELYD